MSLSRYMNFKNAFVGPLDLSSFGLDYTIVIYSILSSPLVRNTS